jgi:hypothetical protein
MLSRARTGPRSASTRSATARPCGRKPFTPTQPGVYKKNCIFAARRLILAGSWGMRIRHHNDPDRRKRLKLLAAVVGGGALVVMGALSINLQPDRGTTDREVQTVAEPMQTGETATTTTPPAAPETSVAVPPVKAPPYGGG